MTVQPNTIQLLVNTARSPESRLPDPQPLTLTRNFGIILLSCTAILCTAPLAIAWIAGTLLK